MTDDRTIETLLEEWFDLRESGGDSSIESFLRGHPAHAKELRSRLEALDVLDLALNSPDGPGATAPAEIAGYRILGEVGRGGMGVVYEAEEVALDRRVALKVLSLAITGAPQGVRRFQREARAAARLHHTNIVPIYGMGQYAGHWYYAMELVEGAPLNDVIGVLRTASRCDADGAEPDSTPSRARTLTTSILGTDTRAHSFYSRAAELFAGLADALHLAHEEGIVHRDVKPSNLLVDGDGLLKIVDFGLARLDGTDSPSMTATGDILGTPTYMSPEQALARLGGVDRRSDVYSLGATLYETLTFHPPFRGQNVQDLLAQVMHKDPVGLRKVNPSIPRDLETIVLKAMEKDRERRYQTAADFARDLRRFADGAGVTARRVSPVTRVWRKVKRHRVRSALVASVLVLLVVGTTFGIGMRRQAERRRASDYDRLLLVGQLAAPESPEIPSRKSYGIYTKAIDLIPDRLDAYWLRATADGATLEERLADVDEAHRRGLPDRTRHLMRAAFLADAQRREEAAAERIRAGELAEQPGRFEAIDRYFEARLLEATGDPDGAEAMLDRVTDSTGPERAVLFFARRRRGKLRLSRGDVGGALEDFVAVRALGGESPLLLVKLARCWRRLGEESRAEELLRQAIRLLEDGASAEDWSWACEVARPYPPYLQQVVGAGLGRYPEAPSLHVCLGVSLAQRGRLEEALEEYGRALELADAGGTGGLVTDPEQRTHFQALVQNNLSSLHLRIGNLDEALAHSREALRLAPDFGGAAQNIATALFMSGRWEEAYEAGQAALRIDPSDADAYHALGLVQKELGREEDARACFQRCVELRSGTPLNTALAFCELDRSEEALALLDRAIAERTAPDDLLAVRGTILGRKGEYEAALRAYDDALALRPLNREALTGKGLILVEHLNRAEKGLAFLLLAQERFPSTKTHYNVGMALERLHRYEEALAAYEQALALDPENASALSNLGAILYNVHRKYDEALRCFEKALALSPDTPLTRMNLGNALHAKGRYDEALAAYDRAVADGLDNATIQRMRTGCLIELNRTEEALRACDQMIGHAPGSSEAHAMRGGILSRLGRHSDAVFELDRAIELDDGNGLAHLNRGLVLLPLGRYRDAAIAFDAAEKRGKATAVSLHVLAWHLVTAGDPARHDPDRAARLLERELAEMRPNAFTWKIRAFIHYRNGDWEKAQEALDNVKSLAGHYDSSSSFLAAMVSAMRGEDDEARDWYERAVELSPAQGSQNEDIRKELQAFQAEAEAVLGMGDDED